MKYSAIFKQAIDCDDDRQVFGYFLDTLKDTITRWDYFVNWAKVFDNISDVEIDKVLRRYDTGGLVQYWQCD